MPPYSCAQLSQNDIIDPNATKVQQLHLGGPATSARKRIDGAAYQKVHQESRKSAGFPKARRQPE